MCVSHSIFLLPPLGHNCVSRRFLQEHGGCPERHCYSSELFPGAVIRKVQKHCHCRGSQQREDSLRWEAAREGAETSPPPQFGRSSITKPPSLCTTPARHCTAHPDGSCWAGEPEVSSHRLKGACLWGHRNKNFLGRPSVTGSLLRAAVQSPWVSSPCSGA